MKTNAQMRLRMNLNPASGLFALVLSRADYEKFGVANFGSHFEPYVDANNRMILRFSNGQGRRPATYESLACRTGYTPTQVDFDIAKRVSPITTPNFKRGSHSLVKNLVLGVYVDQIGKRIILERSPQQIEELVFQEFIRLNGLTALNAGSQPNTGQQPRKKQAVKRRRNASTGLPKVPYTPNLPGFEPTEARTSLPTMQRPAAPTTATNVGDELQMLKGNLAAVNACIQSLNQSGVQVSLVDMGNGQYSIQI